jgi:hypothetical protein
MGRRPVSLGMTLKNHWKLGSLGMVLALGLAACATDNGTDPTDTTADDGSDTTAKTARIANDDLGQEMEYQNWFYCGRVSYFAQIQYWENSNAGITLGAIDVQQYHDSEGIDYTVQIKTVHDDYQVWWSRGPATSSGPHLAFPAASTPATVFPASWQPYVRLYLGADGDGLKNCNFDALLY